MKVIAFFVSLWILNLSCFGQECVRPRVASEFGKPVIVTCEFVTKPNTYYAQNWIKEPFTLKVITVNGQTLREAVLIEYNLKVTRDQPTAWRKQESFASLRLTKRSISLQPQLLG